MHYTIGTEDKNREGIRAILDLFFDAYTMIPSLGCWKGKPEPALTISIAGNVDPLHVQSAAEQIRDMNAQDAVMVLATEAELLLV